MFLLLRGSQLQTDVTFPQHIVLISLTYTLFEQWAARLLNTFKPEAVPAQDGGGATQCMDFPQREAEHVQISFFSALYPVT